VFPYHAITDEMVPFGQAADLRRAWCSKGATVDWTVLSGEHLLGLVEGAPARRPLDGAAVRRPAHLRQLPAPLICFALTAIPARLRGGAARRAPRPRAGVASGQRRA
jgi:hypothetical protein